MSGTTITVSGDLAADQAASDAGVAFAAGTAAATAEQAAEDAEAAELVAEQAAEDAQAAERVAWDAETAVVELRAEIARLRDEIACLQVADEVLLAEVASEVAGETTPAPEPVAADSATDTTDTEKSHGDEKPKPSYGSHRWFGS